MKRRKKKKCRHCRQLFVPDPKNIKKQIYCRKPACKKASKIASHRKWKRGLGRATARGLEGIGSGHSN